MAENNFSVLLEAIIDKSSLTQAQKDLAKQRLKIGVDLDTTSATKNSKKIATELSRITKSNSMRQWADNNSKAMKKYGNEINNLIAKMSNLDIAMDKVESNNILTRFKQIQNEARQTGNIGKTAADKLINAWEKFGGWSLATAAITTSVSKVREAVNELKNLDDILTEINKTSDLTTQELKELGMASYDKASKYGRTASDYLTGVQEMYRAGFDNAEQMAELSVLAQAAGDMELNSANDYIMATNAAYDFKGSVEELNQVLDSQNYITNNAAVSMQDMADATSEAASISAQYGVEINELSAMIATVASKTRETGSEVGTALRSIFVTLQDTTSKPVVEAFNSVGISMTKFVDGAEQLKTPIELLKELSVAFNELPEGAIERSTILTDIGKKYHANTLSAILSDWSSYEQMLELYSSSSAEGSAFREAEKSANNLSGSLNKLSNTWTDTVDNVLNSDTLTTGVNVLNDLLGMVNKLTDALGGLGTVGLAGGLFAGIKNIGQVKMVAC